jgi:N6-L-threonylcarbamoyladenine synthase
VTILGIETSCDETAAAIVVDGYNLLSNVIASSIDLHVPYGGVVPEIAARSHIEVIIPVIEKAIDDAKQSWDQIDGIAVTKGAGLGGSLLIGVLTARTLAITNNKPLYAINHVEGHVYANFLTKTSIQSLTLPAAQPEFPMLAIIVSGGHSQLVLFKDHFKYVILGRTGDDAIGEAFDKVAKMLGLPYPGGPSIATAAKTGDAFAYKLPTAKMAGKYDFSFSGIKTAVLRLAQSEIGEDYNFSSKMLASRLSEAQKVNIAASFQHIAIKTIVDKAYLAFQEFHPASVVIAGGVAASTELRRQLAETIPVKLDYTDPKLCTDNGAMIATLGCFKALHGQPTADPYNLEIEPSLSM